MCVIASACGQPDITRPTPNIVPLSLSCPADMSVDALPGQSSTNVTYTPPTPAGGIIPIQTSCTPQSGTSFPVGATSVSCRSSDAQSSASCSFNVVVRAVVVPRRLSVTNFMGFGDSLTEGKITFAFAPWLLAESPFAYTIQLEALLRERYPQEAITVANEGRGGERVVDGLARFDQALDANRPAVLLLMDGANDIGGGQSAIAPAISAFDTMITHANARGVQVFLATLPPEIPGRLRSGGAAFVAPLNDQIRALAARRNVVLVDVFAAFNPADLESLVGSDGLHLTEAGYAAVARAFYDRIVAAFEVVTTSARR